MKDTILLTGATGFLGSHILKNLLNNNFNVIILKRSFSNTWRIDDILDKTIVYDVDKVDIEKTFKENKIDIVIHTATKYGRKNESFLEILDSNLFFPLKLLDLLLRYNVKTFLNTDTTAYNHFINYYSLTKMQFVEWLKLLDNKIRIFNLKLEYIYGEADDTSKFLPMLIINLLKGVNTIELTPGNQERDFIYVEDVVNAYIDIILKKDNFSNGFYEYSIGSGESIKIKDLVLLIKKITNNEVTQLNFGALPYRSNEIMYSKANIKKIRDEVGWAPKFSLEEGLKRTILWYKSPDNQKIIGDIK
jgi:nucleoside-diphosphate-sugar epimerase